MASFIIPRFLYFGEGAIAELQKIKGISRASIVIGGSAVKKNGALDAVYDNLKQMGVEYDLIEGVENDPTVATVLAGAKKMQEFQPDVIIGLGGGSPIDAAKAMWVFYEYPEWTFEQAAVPFTLPEMRRKAIFVAIPTTSGTATEVTSFAVITDEKTHVKYPIADYNITPDYAILDLNVVQSMPKTLVAHTGMDAITHAIEAYVSTMANEITDGLAMKSMEMIKDYLVASYNGCMEARGKMHIAQCLAGMSFSNAILGIVHSMAHKSGAILKVPHGCANAIYLPHVIRFNAEEAPAKYVDIARRLGLPGATDAELIEALAQMIEKMNEDLGIPATLKGYGVDEELFKQYHDSMAENAVGDPCTGTNPRSVTPEQMKELFRIAYYGK
ncbi:MAG: iron-containing alcohol dehydrogenase [Desulfovibrionaceae bacterium]|nr:iron-containing alcohol dehydrogenase [Desulfovibrionaceae bacterium]